MSRFVCNELIKEVKLMNVIEDFNFTEIFFYEIFYWNFVVLINENFFLFGKKFNNLILESNIK